MFIVVSSAHRTENSFIELGPLIRVSRYRPDDAICVIKSKHFSTLQEYELASIVSGIETRLTSKPKLVKWNKNKKAHRLLLAADLADLYQAIDIKTLIALAEKFGFEVKRNELITQARLLKMLGLIKFKEHGIDRFLCTIGSTGHALLDYNGKVGIRIDRARLKIDARAIIDNDEVLRKSLDLR